MHFDFIEVGTSDFNTQVQTCDEMTFGICVEPVAEYLQRLPDKERVHKHAVAIGRQRGRGQLYFLTPDDLQRHGLPDWMRGCHSLHRPHPSVAKHLEQQGRDPQAVLQTRTVPIWTVADLYAAHDVQTVRLFKVDAEGADAEILLSLVHCCIARGGGWPMIVQFEDNELSDRDQLARAVAALEQHGYRQTDAHDADRTYVRLPADRPAATDLEWLSLDPPVLRHSLTHGLPELYWDLGPQRVYRLVCLTSYVGYDELQRWHAMMRRLRPQDVFHILCNEAWMADRMRLDGIPAHAINHNLFVDDSLFQVRHTERDFDAICVARLNPQKRIEMAAGIRGRLLLVGGSHPVWDPPGYAERLKARLPQAVFHGNGQHVDQTEVVTLMNRAKVGLCLSICEGAMRVSVEYQLCGCRVVTVRNSGGRNEFLSPEHSRTVDPHSVRGIADAVEELASQPYEPLKVRATVLREHQRRRRFPWRPGSHRKWYVRQVVAAANKVCDDENRLPYWSPNQPRHAVAMTITREPGVEPARTILGHATIDTTRHYRERDIELARRVPMAISVDAC